MGIGFSQAVVPPPILVSDLLSEDPDAGRFQLCEYLVKYGFAVLRDTPENVELVRACRGKVSDFFHLPMEEKKKHEVFVTDDIVGKRRVNRGYLCYPHKEFMKMRLTDPPEAYPDGDGLYPVFSGAMKHMNDIVHSALYKLSLGSPDLNNGSDERWITPDFLKISKEFFDGGSSLSVIRYYDVIHPPEESILEEAEKEAPQAEYGMSAETNETDPGKSSGSDHIPCSEHYDTGVFTLILLAEVPGLQVENRETKEWIPIEKVGQTGDFALIMGRKIELIKAIRDLPLKPTFHRVQKSNDVERQSILYFFDLQTSPHD